jgi:hypothetical protein
MELVIDHKAFNPISELNTHMNIASFYNRNHIVKVDQFTISWLEDLWEEVAARQWFNSSEIPMGEW